MNAKDRLRQDAEIAKLKHKLGDTTAKYKQAVKAIATLEREVDAHRVIKPIQASVIKPTLKPSESEATAIVVLSDWHYEEEVRSASVSGLNRFNLQIADRRIEQTFVVAGKMVKIFERDIPITHVVVCLLGDFITSNIHEECVETAQLLPMEAIMAVQKRIVDGLQYLLDTLPNHRFTVVCKGGNHTRITHKQRHATESGNSLETYMYSAIGKSFADDRIRFVSEDGYLGYLDIYNWRICYHHGHSIKYGGGIGGIFIPAFKAIGQWNKMRWADLHLFGHFHAHKDGGSFLCNGSLIGYSAYALSIKADFEKPKQLFFLMDKLRGKTVTCPIVLD